jgi:hypothetical protein
MIPFILYIWNMKINRDLGLEVMGGKKSKVSEYI